jgi:hypothetical protein
VNEWLQDSFCCWADFHGSSLGFEPVRLAVLQDYELEIPIGYSSNSFPIQHPARFGFGW